MNITGKVAIVTGGGSGIGENVARGFAKAGAKVVILDRDMDAATTVAKEIGAAAIECDVADSQSATSAFEVSRRNHGNCHALVHCAGILMGKRILGKDGAADLEHFAKVVNVNLVGSFNMLRLAAAQMSENDALDDGERGIIITTSSIAAYEGQIGQAAYAASKGGVASLTLPAARELARFGIRVMAIAPGMVATPMIMQLPQETQEDLIAPVPFPHRFAQPEEFTKLALHIIDNAMLNGEVIRLDGANRLQPK
ncbi:MAG: SDR family NAD(P)-dependent oxidoreductase [Alphaproteobacteria bacterium]|nr:SDR family NAD(P)-dependent oxidoreductase [Alphaproteobacteria bacterium]